MKDRPPLAGLKPLFFAALAALLLRPSPAAGAVAPELTEEAGVRLSEGLDAKAVLDGLAYTYISLAGGSSVTISQPEGVGGLYLIWNRIPGAWSYRADGAEFRAGENGFLHEYVRLDRPAREVVITIPEGGAELSDLYCFGEGRPPDWVQIWKPPCEKADLLLLPTHADDEQLFFAGVLPRYAGEEGAAVQVAYMTNHWDTVRRPHEQLDGLWTAGVRNYPVIGPFPDEPASLGSKSEAAEAVLQRALSVYDEEAVTEFQVELIRRFRPQVIVGHDFAGEYGHGAHMLNAYTLSRALELSGDASNYPESAEKYGVWVVPKTYMHLYEKNKIVMDWDVPLKRFGGLTAFEVSKLGYACHISQRETWFTGWLNREKAADIVAYSPCFYGLYKSTVGLDTGKGDFFENIVTYAEQEKIAREKGLRLEKELEEARRELEKAEAALRLKHEEALRRREEEKAAAEEARLAEAARLAAKAERSSRLRGIGVLAAALAVVIFLPVLLKTRRGRRGG